MSLITLLGSQDAVDELGKMITDKVEVAIASALGNFELDEAKILEPVRAMIQKEVSAAFAQADKFVDAQLKKITVQIGGSE